MTSPDQMTASPDRSLSLTPPSDLDFDLNADRLREECGEDIFCVGEFWVGDAQTLSDWLHKMHHKFSLFDAPLLYNFNRISTQEKADLRQVFDGSLVKAEPLSAVVSAFVSFLFTIIV